QGGGWGAGNGRIGPGRVSGVGKAHDLVIQGPGLLPHPGVALAGRGRGVPLDGRDGGNFARLVLVDGLDDARVVRDATVPVEDDDVTGPGVAPALPLAGLLEVRFEGGDVAEVQGPAGLR